MKHLTILTGLLVSITCHTQTYDYDYTLEQKILTCLYQHQIDKNIDVISIFNDIEEIFIKKNFLHDKSGSSYIALFKNIIDSNVYCFNNPDLLSDLDNLGYIPSSIFCKDTSYIQVDSVEFAHSKLKYVIGIYDSIPTNVDNLPVLIAKKYF